MAVLPLYAGSEVVFLRPTGARCSSAGGRAAQGVAHDAGRRRHGAEEKKAVVTQAQFAPDTLIHTTRATAPGDPPAVVRCCARTTAARRQMSLI